MSQKIRHLTENWSKERIDRLSIKVAERIADMKDTMLLAHYYSPKEVRDKADFVGDSLDLARIVERERPARLIFAAVRFMAETAKLLSPETEVILPASGAGCSLVDGVTYADLDVYFKEKVIQVQKKKKDYDMPVVNLVYVNSNIESKAWADLVVTSTNVRDIVQFYGNWGHIINFATDRNMGYWLQKEFPQYPINIWDDNTCVVHDKFAHKELGEQIELAERVYGHEVFILAHPESPLPVLQEASFVGSTRQMLEWVKNFPQSEHTQIFVATELELIKEMQVLRPDLKIDQAPTYDGCVCNECPFMKMNALHTVEKALELGERIEVRASDRVKNRARKAIQNMLDFIP